MIPIAGSAYTYGYATLGEIFAWIIGWDLILEYAFGAATVASGWSARWSLSSRTTASIFRRRSATSRDAKWSMRATAAGRDHDLTAQRGIR